MLEHVPYILAGFAGTVIITGASFLVGAIAAVPVVMARSSHNRALSKLATTFIEVVRTVPNLVWLFFVFFGLAQLGIKFDPWTAAIFALGLSSSAYIAEIYRSGLAAISRGQSDAASALGFSSWARGRFIIAPQAARVVGPSLATYSISLVKESALASTIGVMEITFRGGSVTQQTGDGFTTFLIVGAVYLLLSLPIGLLARWLDHRLRTRYAIV